MNEHFRQLLKGTSLMSLAGILQKGVGFFLLPLYTRYLSDADYGAVELFVVLLLMVELVVQQGMASALMKRVAYDKAKDEGTEGAGFSDSGGTAVGTALTYVLISAVVVGSILSVVGAPFSNLVFDQEGYGHLIVLGAFQVLFMAAHKVLLVPLRAQQRYTTVAGISFFIFLAKLAGNLVFLLAFDAGFASLVYGGFCGAVVALAATWVCSHGYVTWGIDRRELGVLTKFGRPLILSSIGFFLLSSTDRVLLRVLDSTSAVGHYSIAAKIGFAFEMVLLGPFMRTWDTVYYRMSREPGAKKVFGTFAARFLGLAFVGALTAHFFAPYLLVVLTTPQFYPAAEAVGLFVLGLFLFTINDILKVGMNIESRTHLLPVRVLSAGAVNIVAGFLLIPVMGIAGAALATVIAYVFMNGFTIWASRSFYRIEYPWLVIGQLTCVAGLTLGAGMFCSQYDVGPVLDIAIKSALLVLLGLGTLRILDLDLNSLRAPREQT